jgi:hypothetical protein
MMADKHLSKIVKGFFKVEAYSGKTTEFASDASPVRHLVNCGNGKYGGSTSTRGKPEG